MALPGVRPDRYPPIMFGSYNPLQRISLTLVTDRLVIVGTVMSRIKRLADLLNDPEAGHLVVIDATFTEVGSRRVVAEAAAAQVQLGDVLFVHANTPTDPGSEMHTSKQSVRACLLVTPFTIEGEIHLAYESELRVALAALQEVYIPVTNARYWSYTVAESPNFVDLLMVNRARAHIAIDAGVEWKTESPGAVQGAGQRDRSSSPW